MYRGKYLKPAAMRLPGSKQISTVILSLLLLLSFTASGTLAYLVADTKPVENRFVPAAVACSISEEFDGRVKKNINVRNDGNIDAYVRVYLISYRVDENGSVIGGRTEIPAIETLGDGWVRKGDYYYYTQKLAPRTSAAVPLVGENGIELKDYSMAYDPAIDAVDLAGGVQVIEVMAEAIQAEGVRITEAGVLHPVTDAWGIQVNQDGSLNVAKEEGQ